jgi:DNA-binding PadR family transcriptional regulator
MIYTRAGLRSRVPVHFSKRSVVTMADRPRSVDHLLPLKPKVLHILLALADGPRHGYNIMQEVAARSDGQVRLWPAALYGALRELERLDLIVESEKRPNNDDERRRYFALTPLGKRVLSGEVRRLEAIVGQARASRALRKAERV